MVTLTDLLKCDRKEPVDPEMFASPIGVLNPQFSTEVDTVDTVLGVNFALASPRRLKTASFRRS